MQLLNLQLQRLCVCVCYTVYLEFIALEELQTPFSSSFSWQVILCIYLMCTPGHVIFMYVYAPKRKKKWTKRKTEK